MAEPQKYKLTAKQKRMLSDYHQCQQATVQTVVPSIGAIDSIESIYKALNGQGEIKDQALLVLIMRNWLTNVSNFDPVSAHALHTGIIDFLGTVGKLVQNESPEDEVKDRVYRIVTHTKDAILAIMKQTRNKILREYAMLPIHAAREIDIKSIQWISRQPGRTLREKLSSKPYIKAVRRRSSVDTSENQLLRAFLFRLEQILIERQNVLSVETEKTCEELLISLQRWFRTEEATEIGVWENLPPNNTLLQDKRYRKVWDAWLWLQTIDEHIKGDCERVDRDILSVLYWSTLSLLNASDRFRVVQQPLKLDYDNFAISPELPIRCYLFSPVDSKTKGRIKNINYEKKFGFLTSEKGADLFFHKSNLSRELDINALSAGDEVSFLIGSNRQGECADNISLPAGIIPVNFSLSGDTWEIQIEADKYVLQMVSGNLVIEQKQGAKKKLKIEAATLKEIPKSILSLVMEARFEYFAPTNNKSGPIRMDSSVVDLCSIRPAFTNNTGSQALLPFRLLQQIWTSKDGSKQLVDCGETRAMVLSNDIETVSMKSLFLHSSTLTDATKSSASMFFIKKLSDYIKADKLTYLVPDWGNDFDLEGIRKSVNFYFDESTPLPKSIAAIFAWQSSKKFVQERVRENDFVLVVDSFDGGISITPVQAIYQKELDEILPETQGMSWERHPTVIVPNRGIHTAMSLNLECNGCKTSEELLHLFGFDGLVSDSGEVSFVKDSHWYHLPGSIRETMTQNLDLNILSKKIIDNYLGSISWPRQNFNIFMLPLKDTIRKGDLHKEYKWLGSSWTAIKGSQTLNRWQEEADEIPLWRDHLPKLSMKVQSDKGYNKDIYLVKDARVTPQRGRTVNIPVEESFTLPAGQTYYSFPLQQGEGNKELQFVAYLESPALPLKKATPCKLKMTYTYGANNPYELQFIPLDSAEASFNSILVEWRSASKSTSPHLESLPVPDFPARKSWADFQDFLKEDGKGSSNLLDWVESKLILLDSTRLRDEVISNIVNKRLNRLKKERVAGTFKWGTSNDRGGYYCFVDVDGEDIYCSASAFKENIHCDSLQEGQVVYLNIIKKQDRTFGSNISFYDEFPNEIAAELHDYEMGKKNINHDEIIQRNAGYLEKSLNSLRFPVLTIWNHDNSLSESDVPNRFRNAIFEATQKISSIIESENIPKSLKDELFFFLCCLHKDAPKYVSSRLLGIADNLSSKVGCHRNIAFSIGRAELAWQEKLLAKLLDYSNLNNLAGSLAVEALAIALWRSEKLVHKISKQQLVKLTKNLSIRLELDLKKLSSPVSPKRIHRLVDKGLSEEDAVAREREYQVSTLCKHLELLLALLRSRGSEDGEIKIIFNPVTELAKRYATLVDNVSRVVIDSNIELKSRISLKIEKPEIFRNTPDLLYAVRMYLTGDSGANTILITEVIEV
ncbi:DUF2357 domain-containing protein [Lentisphaera marina]|uniref:DUF2357 domain-containing protein n=1 Tax=Lentisphaera marina TaxID=1111041 RepID=UPI002366DE0C|nr:DUF2357 domain-containing protein [Lentisphaera marina]MDD7984716.1 DUF2357 domain-containing protein [Lentisphaera marina]